MLIKQKKCIGLSNLLRTKGLDNIILHLPSVLSIYENPFTHEFTHQTYYQNYDRECVFELLSRARKRMIIIVDYEYVEIDDLFFETINEMRSHPETCTNITCQEKGWDKLKVIEVKNVLK